MPAVLLTLIPWIQAVIKAAPNVIDAVNVIKQTISGLFGAKIIDAATQDRLFKHVDDTVTSFVKGTPPPEWTVEPDPA